MCNNVWGKSLNLIPRKTFTADWIKGLLAFLGFGVHRPWEYYGHQWGAECFKVDIKSAEWYISCSEYLMNLKDVFPGKVINIFKVEFPSNKNRLAVSSKCSFTLLWAGLSRGSSFRQVYFSEFWITNDQLQIISNVKTLQNLKSDISLNGFLPSETTQVWVPELVFENTVRPRPYFWRYQRSSS